MKDSVKDYVPVDTLIDINKLLVLLMFRSVMVHTRGIIEFLGRTILPFVETYVLHQIGFCASILSGLCWTVLDTLHRQWRGIPPKVGFFTAKISRPCAPNN